jgi:hypothetical protein
MNCLFAKVAGGRCSTIETVTRTTTCPFKTFLSDALLQHIVSYLLPQQQSILWPAHPPLQPIHLWGAVDAMRAVH